MWYFGVEYHTCTTIIAFTLNINYQPLLGSETIHNDCNGYFIHLNEQYPNSLFVYYVEISHNISDWNNSGRTFIDFDIAYLKSGKGEADEMTSWMEDHHRNVTEYVNQVHRIVC